ncbi:MAG: hypothetical protein ABFS46_14420 [Myxococcota bacterium]
MDGEGHAGPPPLRPFGLVLHHDGSWTHEGIPITHPRLRSAFDRAVRWLPGEARYVVQLGRFRGQIEVEEAGFFVREVDLEIGSVRLSDGSRDLLDPASLRPSPRDGALLCTVKRELVPGGLAARFSHAAQAELLQAVEEGEEGPCLQMARASHPLPGLASGTDPRKV